MAVVNVVNTNGEKISEVELLDSIYDIEIKPGILHEVVRMQLAKRRAGTACTQHRSEVTGSTRKLYRQKGTGRARKGSIKSPLLRGGGVVFGPKPRSYEFSIPKKVRKLALKMALSSKFKENQICVVDKIEMAEIKTKNFVKILDSLNKKNVLFITDKDDEKVIKSSQNVQNVKFLRVEGLNVYDILKYKNVILLEPSIKFIEKRCLA